MATLSRTKRIGEEREREKEAIDSLALPHSLVLPVPLIFSRQTALRLEDLAAWLIALLLDLMQPESSQTAGIALVLCLARMCVNLGLHSVNLRSVGSTASPSIFMTRLILSMLQVKRKMN